MEVGFYQMLRIRDAGFHQFEVEQCSGEVGSILALKRFEVAIKAGSHFLCGYMLEIVPAIISVPLIFFDRPVESVDDFTHLGDYWPADWISALFAFGGHLRHGACTVGHLDFQRRLVLEIVFVDGF